MVRMPAVAGKFYSADPVQLRQELSEMIPQEKPAKAIGVIAPHAGYVYSGSAAGKVYAAVEVPDAILVLGPNHTGMGAAAALAPPGEWLTPFGLVPVNERLSQLIMKHAPMVREDSTAHRFEHSLEVQVPFLQYRNQHVSIAALCLSLPDFDSISRVGEGIARAIAEYGAEVLMVASSDMTHYESAAKAKAKDELALERLTEMDPEGLLKVCRDHEISMCGVIPATAMLVAAKALGATASRLVCYTNSGEVSGDLDAVVAYAGLTVS